MNRNQYKNNWKTKKRTEAKLMVLKYLADNPCVVCGESDPIVLEFDHVDRAQKEMEISKMVNACMNWESILAEIRKCRVLCANCHKRHTYAQLGFWKNIQ